MGTLKSNKVKLILLEWCDAITSFDGWTDLDEIIEWGKTEEWIIKQAGYIVEENREYILIASKYNPQRRGDKYSEITKIPKTWIRKRKIISSLF
jgi:hypothetical protein